MNRKSLITLSVLAALSAGTAVAATQADPVVGQPQRASLDTNGDGYVDRSEAAKSPRLTARFDEFDANQDGRLSSEEMAKRAQRGAGRHGPRGDGAREAMTRLDSNQDGRISRAEAAGDAKFAARFEQMDANKDGYADRADRELRTRQRKDEWFAGADTDKDGKLSQAEVGAAKSMQPDRAGSRSMKAPAR